MDGPKVFISYSWSSSEHEQWILDFATELRESRVDVVLDKWDLKDGHDAVAFMEQMVTNPDIKKVIIVSDKKYATKADGRAGGVGTETQIISREMYENQSQDKFVAVVSENDDAGKPFLPTYYKSRIYIDLSSAERYADNFERLLRWIYDKPLYVKPELGAAPAFLGESNPVSLGTAAAYKRCIDAIKAGRPGASGALTEYCKAFASNLERFRLQRGDGEFDDAVMKSLSELTPYRNEAIQVFVAIAQYSASIEFVSIVHRFFEDLIPYLEKPVTVNSWNDSDFDNFKFFIHELFMYALAVMLKYERFGAAAYLLSTQYYMPGRSDYGRDVMVDFTIFRTHLPTLETRNRRLNLRRISLHADLLKERSAGTGLDFRHLLQADFVAFLRAENAGGTVNNWFPITLVLLGHFNSPFEIFARSASKAFFDKTKILLGLESPQDLKPLLTSYQEGKRQLPRWDYTYSFNPTILLGFEQLASRP